MQYKGLSPLSLLQALTRGLSKTPEPRLVLLCVADHFEPEWNGANKRVQAERLQHWLSDYPRWFGEIGDSRGKPPQHTFFYPAEVYDAEHLDGLAKLTHQGYGDVEVHLHHDKDEASRLRDFLLEYTEMLVERHGLLSRDRLGRIRYGFVHGNWALDDSHPDGCWCGVRNEIDILIETGCYADFTMPAAPHGAQTSTINSIYYATDDPQRPKSHDKGQPAMVGQTPPANSLLMIQGPLVLSRSGRSWHATPKLENGNIAAGQGARRHRIDDWLKANIHVRGQADWIFVKLHTHGAQDANRSLWLSEEMQQFHRELGKRAIEGGWQYYYVTARQMAQCVRQAELGFDQPDWDQLDWNDTAMHSRVPNRLP